MTPESKLLCIHIADAPEVARYVRALTTRIESLEAVV